MAKDASIQSDRRCERLSSTTNTAPRCTLWLSISIFSAHPSSKNWSSSTTRAISLMSSCWTHAANHSTTNPAKWNREWSKRSSRNLSCSERENLTEFESRSERGENMGREFVGKTVRSIPLLVLALASMGASCQAHAKPNHLRCQTSQYLKRALPQPVHWYHSRSEAFNR